MTNGPFTRPSIRFITVIDERAVTKLRNIVSRTDLVTVRLEAAAIPLLDNVRTQGRVWMRLAMPPPKVNWRCSHMPGVVAGSGNAPGSVNERRGHQRLSAV
jgi:hypothetical protein